MAGEASGGGGGDATRWCLLLGSRVGGDRARGGRVRDQNWSLLRQGTVTHDGHEGTGGARMIARRVGKRRDYGALREPAIDRRYQVGPGRVPACLEHRLHEGVAYGFAVHGVAVPWLL